jgi:hypothetical protein
MSAPAGLAERIGILKGFVQKTGPDRLDQEEMHLVNDRARRTWHWWVVFLVTQCTALLVVDMLEPAGFDRCEATPSYTVRVFQVLAAGIATAGAIVLALWQLRQWRLFAALTAIGLATLAWLGLLAGSENC